MRPGWPSFFEQVLLQRSRRSAVHRHGEDAGMTCRSGIEDNRLAIGGPANAAQPGAVKIGKPLEIGAILVRKPDLGAARPIRHESDMLAIRGVAGEWFLPVEESSSSGLPIPEGARRTRQIFQFSSNSVKASQLPVDDIEGSTAEVVLTGTR